MRTDRLVWLADHLEHVVAAAPETFDMRTWTGVGRCGTTCCAMGHACMIPEFRAVGLSMSSDGRPEFHTPETLFVGFKAAEQFFEISENVAERLFYDFCYSSYPFTTPGEVAARIRELVASVA